MLLHVELADPRIVLAVAGLSAIAMVIVRAMRRRWQMFLLLLGLTAVLSGLWQGYGTAVYRLLEPVVLVSLFGGWLWGYRRWGGHWGLAVLGLLTGIGFISTADAASWLPLLWGAGLGAIMLGGGIGVAIATLADQGLYALLSHSPLVVAVTKLTALGTFSGLMVILELRRSKPTPPRQK